MALTLTPGAPTAEVPLDQEMNGGGVLQVMAIDGLVVVEGTADHKYGSWFLIAVSDYPSNTSVQGVNSPGGYYFNLVGLTHMRARLASGNSAVVALNAKVY